MIGPLKNKSKFINPSTSMRIDRTFFDFLLWTFGFLDNASEHIIAPNDFRYPSYSKDFTKEKPTAVWINHSTFLISFNPNLNILTDPIWNDNCSPVSFAGPKRRHLPAILLSELPKIHYVFISHNHYDHLDKTTVLALHKMYPDIRWMVPMGVKKWFLKRGITNIFELNWFEQSCFRDHQIEITFTPAQHFSGRSIFDTNKTLWGGFVASHMDKIFYFSGDTGYNKEYFKVIGEKFGSIDLSLIPIGSYLPRKFMQPIHTNPKEAVQIHLDVNSKLSIGMHFKTFKLSDEKLDIPPYELFLALQNAKIDHSKFMVLEPGFYVNW